MSKPGSSGETYMHVCWETWSVNAEDEPRDPARLFAKPLISDPARDNELDRVLKKDVCSVRANDEPREPVKVSVRPLNREVVLEIEPVRLLKIDVCSVSAEDMPSEP